MKYPCDSCNYQATSNGNLTTHKQSRHEGKKYPCDSCGYQATFKGDLTRHKQSRHEGKMYPCDLCEYQTSQRWTQTDKRKAVNQANLVRKHFPEKCGHFL